MSQAKRASVPRETHIGTRSCEDVSGETGQSTSSQDISGPKIPRMSEVKRARASVGHGAHPTLLKATPPRHLPGTAVGVARVAGELPRAIPAPGLRCTARPAS